MDTRTKAASMLLPLIAIIALTFGVAGASAATAPLKGTFDAVETSSPGFPFISSTGTGSGHATQLGHYTVSYTVVIDVTTGAGTASATFVAADGGSVSAEGIGQFTPASPSGGTIVEWYTITGGTGRFAGASGTFTIWRDFDFGTGATSGMFEGTIVLANPGP